MKTKILLFLLGMQALLFAQSSISVGTGSLITIGSGANISAGSKSGSFTGGGTFNGVLLNEPYSATLTPTNVTNTSATINATVNPQGYTTTYYFSYGTDPANLTTNTTSRDAGSGSTDVNISENISGLTANTIYYYKVTATNENGTTVSDTRLLFTDNSFSKTNLVVWLRADQGVTSSSVSVSEWLDLSSNNNKADQSNSSNRPTIVSGAINSNPAIRFNGTSNFLTLPYTHTIGIKDNPYEIFIVAKSSSSNIQFLLSGTEIEKYEYHLNGPGVRFIPTTGAYLDKGTAGNYTDGNAHIFSARASSSGGAVRVDGIDGSTSLNNIQSSSAINLVIGYRGADASYYLNGDIAEVILYNTNLSTSDRSTVEHYLANRYGITSGALPVELTSFSAECRTESVELKWTTATEVNNYGFSVERRVKSEERASMVRQNSPQAALGMTWEKIAFVQGHGNSNSPKSYFFTDNLALARDLNLNRLEYRLKQIDFDGAYEYSDVVEVKIETPTEFKLAQNFPNPFNPSTTINYQLSASSHVTLKVFDVLGREVATLVDEFKTAGTYNSTFSTLRSSFSSGVYFYQLKAGGFVQTKKFILTK